MKIFNAVIATYAQYEGRLNDAHNEFGADLDALHNRMFEAAKKIAPESAWTNARTNDEVWMECTVDGVDYVMSTQPIELVC